MPAALLGEVDRQAGNAARQGLPDHREAAFGGDTTRRHEIAVGVGKKTLPGGADRREVRRMQSRRLVLRERQIRHTQHAHPAAGPGLGSGPFDQIVGVTGLVVGQQRAGPVGGARTPRASALITT